MSVLAFLILWFVMGFFGWAIAVMSINKNVWGRWEIMTADLGLLFMMLFGPINLLVAIFMFLPVFVKTKCGNNVLFRIGKGGK